MTGADESSTGSASGRGSLVAVVDTRKRSYSLEERGHATRPSLLCARWGKDPGERERDAQG